MLHVSSVVAILMMMGHMSGQLAWEELRVLAADARYPPLASVYVASVAGGSVLVRLVVQPFGRGLEERPGLIGAGAYIGVLERLLLTSLVALGQFGAVGLVIAAKSVARYRQIEDVPGFAEYYLVGTLTSSAIAVVAGLMVKALLGSL